MSRSLSAIAMIFTGAVLVSGLIAPVATADNVPGQAGSGKSLVVMGDSNTANATWVPTQPTSTGETCAHQATSWPTQLGERMELAQNDIENVSCVGAYMYRHGTDVFSTALTQARKATAAGAFGTRTRAVLLQFGLNDVWGEDHKAQTALIPCLMDLQRGCSTADAATNGYPPTVLTGQTYADHLRDIVTYIRFYAPNARIVLVGYQELHTPGDQAFCINVMGVPLVIPRAGAVTDVFDSVRAAPRAAAELLDVEFFDAAAVTAGHGLCSDEPWLTGLFTPGPEVWTQPGHPTVEGDAAVAEGLQKYLAAPAPQRATR